MSYVMRIVADGLLIVDEVQYEKVETARAEAIKAAQDLMGRSLLEGKRIAPEDCIEILDETGHLADTVRFQEAAFTLQEHQWRLR